jgi:hypothetical protein
MPIILDTTLTRNDDNTIDMSTPYSDVNIKSSQITEDMVSHLEIQIQKAQDDFNGSIEADVLAIHTARDVAIGSASIATTAANESQTSAGASALSATSSYNSSVSSTNNAAAADVSATASLNSENSAEVSATNALNSASTATTASLVAVDARDIVVPLATQVTLDTATSVDARDTAVANAVIATDAATSTAINVNDANIDAIRAELAAQNAEQSALTAVDFIGYKGVWHNVTTYNTGDTVSFGRLLYACNLDGVVTISPEHIQNTNEWFFLGRDHNKYVIIVDTYVAEPNDYIILEADHSFIITLPITHVINDTITIYTGETSEEFNIVLNGNGDLFKRLTIEDSLLTIDTNGLEFKLVSNGTDWRIIV